MSNEEYKAIINQFLNRLDDSDNKFMKQIYTLVKKHLERKGKR